MTVHSALPERLEAAVAEVLAAAGVTRDDEPGCEEEPAKHRGTVLRMVARDTVVAARIAAHVEHGDPVDPPVWLWRADRDRVLRGDRAL
jgi:hypothetical protein